MNIPEAKSPRPFILVFMKFNKIALFGTIFIAFLSNCAQNPKKTEVLVKSITKDGNVLFTDGTSRAIPYYNDSTAIILYLVRHAEKNRAGGDDPDLTAEGRARAVRLYDIFKDAYVSRVVFSNKKRTQLTLAEVRKHLDPPFETVPADVVPMVLSNELYQEDRGRKILVAHHSNTIPIWLDFVTGGKHQFPPIDDADFGRFFIVSTRAKGDSEVMDLRY